jgi:cytoskeleton protein RodZ
MADIGSTLREARMRQRIDITEVEARTKIRAKYLRAIENEEWDLLPGPVYIRSFLRTYGDFLGLDSRALVDEFKRRYERPSDHEMRPISSLQRDRERAARGPLLPAWGLIGIVLVGVVVALFLLGGGFGGGGSSSTPTTSVNTTTNQSKAKKTRHRAAATRPKTARLALVPTGTVYVCLVDGTGRKLINQKTYSAGQRIPAETAPKLLLTLGNNAVKMTVNGKAVRVGASAQAIRLLIGPTSYRPISLTAKPTCP